MARLLVGVWVASLATALVLPIGSAGSEPDPLSLTSGPGCGALGFASAPRVDADLFSLPAGDRATFDTDTVIQGRTLALDGILRTADAAAPREDAPGLCLEVERLELGPAGVLCTGAGFSPRPVFALRDGSPVVGGDGTDGGRLVLILRDDPATTALPGFSIPADAVVCTGDGGRGGHAVAFDTTFRADTERCVAVPDPSPVLAEAGAGGDAGRLELFSGVNPSALGLPVGAFVVGRGGSGGTALAYGNPAGHYQATGGKGGDGIARLNGELPFHVASFAGANGGNGGAALALACPEAAGATDPSPPASPDAGQNVCAAAIGALEPTAGPLTWLWQSTYVSQSFGVQYLCSPRCDLQSPPVECILYWLRDYCLQYAPCKTLNALAEQWLGVPLFGEQGEGVEATSAGGGNGHPGYTGKNGAFIAKYSYGVSGSRGGAGASASVSCPPDNKPGEDGGAGGNAFKGDPAAASGGWGGDGLLVGGDGGYAKAQGSRGGRGGDGGQGGDAAVEQTVFCGVQSAPAGRGGDAGNGGDAGGGKVNGGNGGNSTVQPGKGGDAEVDPGKYGLGGNGGDGGAGDALLGCIWVPGPPPGFPPGCVPDHEEEPDGARGCGGHRGGTTEIRYVGGVGGRNLITPLLDGPHGTPLEETGKAYTADPKEEWGHNGNGAPRDCAGDAAAQFMQQACYAGGLSPGYSPPASDPLNPCGLLGDEGLHPLFEPIQPVLRAMKDAPAGCPSDHDLLWGSVGAGTVDDVDRDFWRIQLAANPFFEPPSLSVIVDSLEGDVDLYLYDSSCRIVCRSEQPHLVVDSCLLPWRGTFYAEVRMWVPEYLVCCFGPPAVVITPVDYTIVAV